MLLLIRRTLRRRGFASAAVCLVSTVQKTEELPLNFERERRGSGRISNKTNNSEKGRDPPQTGPALALEGTVQRVFGPNPSEQPLGCVGTSVPLPAVGPLANLGEELPRAARAQSAGPIPASSCFSVPCRIESRGQFVKATPFRLTVCGTRRQRQEVPGQVTQGHKGKKIPDRHVSFLASATARANGGQDFALGLLQCLPTHPHHLRLLAFLRPSPNCREFALLCNALLACWHAGAVGAAAAAARCFAAMVTQSPRRIAPRPRIKRRRVESSRFLGGGTSALLQGHGQNTKY